MIILGIKKFLSINKDMRAGALAILVTDTCFGTLSRFQTKINWLNPILKTPINFCVFVSACALFVVLVPTMILLNKEEEDYIILYEGWDDTERVNWKSEGF